MTEQQIQESIEAHQARNAELKQLLVNRGVDLRIPRAIDCHFWAGSMREARALAHALRSRGFSIVAQRRAATMDSAFPWNVEAQVVQSVDLTVRREFSDDLVRLAHVYNSVYDGWGTSI